MEGHKWSSQVLQHQTNTIFMKRDLITPLNNEDPLRWNHQGIRRLICVVISGLQGYGVARRLTLLPHRNRVFGLKPRKSTLSPSPFPLVVFEEGELKHTQTQRKHSTWKKCGLFVSTEDCAFYEFSQLNYKTTKQQQIMLSSCFPHPRCTTKPHLHAAPTQQWRGLTLRCRSCGLAPQLSHKA